MSTKEIKSDASVTCGIIMPIGDMEGYGKTQWSDVLNILKEIIESIGYLPKMVSDSDDVTIIHKNIIHNIYHNPIVICDVSGKNPNVMFELGMRLAFDKPTIIIKDNATNYSFDTGIIEHITYPKDLRFSEIIEFKKKLADKIKATYEKSISDTNQSTFLKHFGEYKIAKINEKEISSNDFIIEELKNIRNDFNLLSNTIKPKRTPIKKLSLRNYIENYKRLKNIKGDNNINQEELFDYLESYEEIRDFYDGPQDLKDKIFLELLPF